MTKQEFINQLKADKDFTDKLLKLFANLYERWQDEKQYEDINDYLLALKKVLPTAYAIHKRPFSVDCKFDDGNMNVGVKAKGNYLNFFVNHI